MGSRGTLGTDAGDHAHEDETDIEFFDMLSPRSEEHRMPIDALPVVPASCQQGAASLSLSADIASNLVFRPNLQQNISEACHNRIVMHIKDSLMRREHTQQGFRVNPQQPLKHHATKLLDTLRETCFCCTAFCIGGDPCGVDEGDLQGAMEVAEDAAILYAREMSSIQTQFGFHGLPATWSEGTLWAGEIWDRIKMVDAKVLETSKELNVVRTKLKQITSQRKSLTCTECLPKYFSLGSWMTSGLSGFSMFWAYELGPDAASHNPWLQWWISVATTRSGGWFGIGAKTTVIKAFNSCLFLHITPVCLISGILGTKCFKMWRKAICARKELTQSSSLVCEAFEEYEQDMKGIKRASEELQRYIHECSRVVDPILARHPRDSASWANLVASFCSMRAACEIAYVKIEYAGWMPSNYTNPIFQDALGKERHDLIVESFRQQSFREEIRTRVKGCSGMLPGCMSGLLTLTKYKSLVSTLLPCLTASFSSSCHTSRHPIHS